MSPFFFSLANGYICTVLNAHKQNWLQKIDLQIKSKSEDVEKIDTCSSCVEYLADRKNVLRKFEKINNCWALIGITDQILHKLIITMINDHGLNQIFRWGLFNDSRPPDHIRNVLLKLTVSEIHSNADMISKWLNGYHHRLSGHCRKCRIESNHKFQIQNIPQSPMSK